MVKEGEQHEWGRVAWIEETEKDELMDIYFSPLSSGAHCAFFFFFCPIPLTVKSSLLFLLFLLFPLLLSIFSSSEVSFHTYFSHVSGKVLYRAHGACIYI